MQRIKVLDCTLRDGGYINSFDFGRNTIEKIIYMLGKAAVDVIECGFLRSGADDEKRSVFGSIEAIRTYLLEKNPNSIYVGMIQYGAIDANDLCDYDGTSIDGIRLTFHEHEIDGAFEMAYALKKKGYKVFIQPVGTTTYGDIELINLVQQVNKLRPYAFYLVDTLGTMDEVDLQRMVYLVDGNLDKRIQLGFHSHNNLQMSYANAQTMIKTCNTRKMIIDSSILGMGRGAGNLNTELIIHYLNRNYGLKYDQGIILNLIDEYIMPLKRRYSWGYDTAFYLAAITNTHPNYASYLLNLKTLEASDISAILNSLDPKRRILFDKEYIMSEYLKYMEHYVEDSTVVSDVSQQISGKKIVLIAPGKSFKENQGTVKRITGDENVYAISVNFIPKDIPINMLFVSNMKRFSAVGELSGIAEVIITSNIKAPDFNNVHVVNYTSYLNEDPAIIDNAGLMCINFLKRANAKSIMLIGFDGFSANISDNYYEESLFFDVEQERLMQMNIATTKKIAQLKNQIDIQFMGATAYEQAANL